MPLIANTIIITGEAETSSPKDVVADAVATDQPVLIVNGKAKKVGKHSSYLLDMLTIEEQ